MYALVKQSLVCCDRICFILNTDSYDVYYYGTQDASVAVLWDPISAVCLPCSALVPLERLIEETIQYTRERKAFGRSILDNQVVHFRLAELLTEVELLRSLIYRATGELLPCMYMCSYMHYQMKYSLSVCVDNYISQLILLLLAM